MSRNTMEKSTSNTIHVTGATIYYQTRGEGPMLLLIAGGAGDADSFAVEFSHFLQPKPLSDHDLITC